MGEGHHCVGREGIEEQTSPSPTATDTAGALAANNTIRKIEELGSSVVRNEEHTPVGLTAKGNRMGRGQNAQGKMSSTHSTGDFPLSSGGRADGDGSPTIAEGG